MPDSPHTAQQTPPLRGRLAPSPTGGLHVGNVRTLMLAWLSCRSAGGAVVLRVEDLDPARCKPGFTSQLLADLRWLGFDWDEGPDVGGPHAPYLQSQRHDQYRAALERLAADGLAYPCVCSRLEVAAAASAPHGPAGPAYPGTCRGRFRDATEARKRTGREPAWRFDSRRSPAVSWHDAFQTDTGMPAAVDDFVLWRADGTASYQLAVVVDDLAMQISEVVRGHDLADSTPRQLALIAAFAATPPAYRHVPLVLDTSNRRLAKRSGATQVAELRRLGVRPEQIIGLLAASSGMSASSGPAALRELTGSFTWERVRRTPVRIGEADLAALAPRSDAP